MNPITYWDEDKEDLVEISINDLEDKLKDLVEAIKRMIGKLERIDKYHLNEFEVSLSLKAGLFVISAEGAITLKYETS